MSVLWLAFLLAYMVGFPVLMAWFTTEGDQ